MEVRHTRNAGSTVVEITGRLDTITSGAFETEILGLLESEDMNMLIDCSGLEYISSTGLRVLLMAQKKMLGKGGSLSLCCLQPGIEEIFSISGFSSIFSIYPDRQAAGQ